MHATELKLVYARKHPFDSSDIIALEASLTIQVEPAESEDATILAGFRHLAALLREAVDGEIAAITAQDTTDPPPGYAPAEPPAHGAQASRGVSHTPVSHTPVSHTPEAPTPPPAPAGPPATPREAERRFFTRYGEIVGGLSWLDVRAYLGISTPKPRTIDQWIAAAEAVRNRSRQQAAAAD